jgi:hypothetical protein
MEDITWLIYFISLMGLSLIGIFIYSKKRLREKVNMKEVWQFFWIIFILRIFDVISTIYFTKKIGIEYEGNVLARIFMEHLGIYLGISMIFFLTIPLMFFWFVLLNYILKDKIGWKIFKMLTLTISIIIPIINFLT